MDEIYSRTSPSHLVSQDLITFVELISGRMNIEEDLLKEDQIRRATLKMWTEISRSNKAKFIDDKSQIDALIKEYQTLKKRNNVTEALLV